MNTIVKTISMGFALFAMFFGAGNLLFPLSIGQVGLDKNIFAMAGLIITAVGVPFLGVAAMMLFRGNVDSFFNRLGKYPAFLVITAIMGLIGPFYAIPRCMLLTYTALEHSFGVIPLTAYVVVGGLVLYVLTISQKRLLAVLGSILTPLLLLSITVFIYQGLTVPAQISHTAQSAGSLFKHGFVVGYQTLDLLAAFFFSRYIISGEQSKKQGVVAAIIGAALLGIVYTGLSFVAAKHAPLLINVPPEELLPRLSMALLGPVGGLVAILTVALACLTTAITLSAVFADYLKEKIFINRISYKASLGFTLVIAGVICHVGFGKLLAFMVPLLQICYPALILLTILNIFYKMQNFKPVKMPVTAAFLVGLCAHFIY
ncbi:MAG: branched-chain amino acid transport system II carrier protein [Parachlamydiales bacterium]|nr:branched-chain amino acid transport system II carrier protein [Parachlamydiales bacterium]